MKQYLISMILPLILLVGCSQDRLVSPESRGGPLSSLNPAGFDAELAAAQIMAVTDWAYDPEAEIPDRMGDGGAKCVHFILDWSREVLIGNIAHYEFLVQVGPGEFDRIKLHRVVKERRPLWPIKTQHALMLQHGDAVGFVKFLYGHAAPSAPDDHAAAIFLAQNDIDVWGLDQNWVLVPEETADFGFMQHWGMDNQLGNLHAALSLARLTRLATGNGFRKMHLLGYSSGGVTGYAYLNAEAVLPYGHRHVKGFVCADIPFKFSPEDDAHRQFICEDVAVMRDLLDAGEYGYFTGFELIGSLAANDPDGDSPIVPGWTNRQLALVYGGATYMMWPFNSWWHYFGAFTDAETGMPTDFRFTDFAGVTDFMRLGCPWEAMRFLYDYEVIMCDEEDVPWDDNLALVDMPILYLEPAGGIGSTGRYTLGLFGSADVEILTISLLPPDQISEDFGHIDIWTAPQADYLVWQPLLEWIVSHPGRYASEGDDLAIINVE